MREPLRTMARAAALLAFLVVAAHYPVNVPLSLEEGSPRYSRRQLLGGPTPNGIFMHAAFSGGGARAAAMAYGVLEVLDETTFVRDGRKARLIDQLSIIAGVSGGAVAAGAYAVSHGDFFRKLGCDFLYRDFAGALASRLLSPATLHRLTSKSGRVEVLAEALDEHLFSASTYGDIARGGAPWPSFQPPACTTAIASSSRRSGSTGCAATFARSRSRARWPHRWRSPAC